ncbi:MAG: Ferric uptake regulation protein [Alphaproteobacteria bacterium MarineAlpha9_Bin3]|nr:MAG: Ferric uptake regulation protein [Alphaproteobacteria bacterium MarineAlpha9_Bin3]|tara:strand:- start:15083 stop:15490 length:408 start_codon:yes stop_codon:yes gene_type:complete
MAKSAIEVMCASKGIKLTHQRKVIAKVLSKADDHPDANLVFKRSSKIDSNISMATVYRTMKLFEDTNIVVVRDFGDGRSRYEIFSNEHHDHLIDTDSGDVIEFVNEEIEELQHKVAKKLGYTLTGHRLELYGKKK